MIFVRHAKSAPDPAIPESEWPLAPDAVVDLLLPSLPVVCSDTRRARDTAAYFGTPRVDDRLVEIRRPWTDDIERDVARYLRGEEVSEWEPQRDALARFEATLAERGEAIYVTHGTVLSLYLGSVVPDLDAFAFWQNLTMPDAWALDGGELRRY